MVKKLDRPGLLCYPLPPPAPPIHWDSYSPGPKWILHSQHISIFLAYSERTVVSCPIISLCFEFLERRIFFSFWILVEGLTIWDQGKEDWLTWDKQYDIVFLPMYNCFLNYQVFPHNGKCYSSFQTTLKF